MSVIPDSRSFRDALSRFATGVCVVTAVDPAGRHVGVTISSFASLSLEPPLVLFCIDRKSTAVAAYTEGAAFAVNVLSETQKAVAEAFARQAADKFATVEARETDNGCRILEGCLANLECRRTDVFDGGDHFIVVGEVTRIHRSSAGGPLARFRGQYRRLGDLI